MRLADVCARFFDFRFPRIGEDAHPDRESIVQMRSIVREALATDEFLVDCISHELRSLATGRPRERLVSFFKIPELGIKFSLGYWPPGSTPGPHEHTAWGITAVCRNRLSVATFDRPESYRRRELVAKNVFAAEAGAAGFIYEPSIHAPSNLSKEWSLSMHITSPRDGECVDDFEPLTDLLTFSRSRAERSERVDPYSWVLRVRARHREVHLLARTLLSTHAPGARELLAKCFCLASSSTRKRLLREIPDLVEPGASPRRLTRTHQDLRLHVQRLDDGCALLADTPRGLAKIFGYNDEAHQALAFASDRLSFDVAALPGNLSEDERTAIADALEDTGVFKRVEA